MQRLAASPVCRHKWIVEHFGQAFPERGAGGCGACDVCLGEVRMAPDSTTIARKLLSAVARTGQRYGAAYVADVARGVLAPIEQGLEQTAQRAPPLTLAGVIEGCAESAEDAIIGNAGRRGQGPAAGDPGPLPAQQIAVSLVQSPVVTGPNVGEGGIDQNHPRAPPAAARRTVRGLDHAGSISTAYPLLGAPGDRVHT